MAIGRGGPGLRSVRNLCLFKFADAMVLAIVGATAAGLHGSANQGVPVYYSGAFIALPLLATIAALGFAVYQRSKNCISRPDVAQKIALLMRAYCVCLLFSWPGWLLAMMLTGITGICRTSGCSYAVHLNGNFAMSVVILVCIALGLFANVLCTMLLYVYCSEMGLTMYGTKRIQIEDELYSQSGSPKFSRLTATAECQTLPSLRSTSTAQCQTQSVISVRESAFRPIQSASNPRPPSQNETSSPVWAIPSEKTPPGVKQSPKKKGKRKGKNKRHKEKKYKNSTKSPQHDSVMTPVDSSGVYSTSAVDLDSFGSLEHRLTKASPPHHLSFRQTPLSPENIHSPDYLHVQLPNAPLSPDQEQSLSYQVSYLPFTRTQRASPSPYVQPIRIPTAMSTRPADLSPPPTPTFRTNAWEDSSVSSNSSSPVRCKTPQPTSSVSSVSSRSCTGDPYIPTLQSRYNPTPPPVLSPRGRGMLYTDACEEEDSQVTAV